MLKDESSSRFTCPGTSEAMPLGHEGGSASNNHPLVKGEIGFIGLGHMGTVMAANLANAGCRVMRLALAEAENAGVPMPSISVVRDRLITGIARGYAGLDWTALGLVAAEEAGLQVLPPVALN
jgi:hypothetical protein